MRRKAASLHSDGQLLDALYGGAVDEREFDRALALLMEHFGCCAAALVSLDTHLPEPTVSRTVGVFAGAAATYLEHFAAVDPAPARFARLPVGAASTTDRIISPEERRQSAFLHEFYLPLGLEETLGGNLSSDNARFELIGLQRGPDRQAFAEEDIAALERLLPHVARALQLRRTFRRLEARVAGLEAALDRLEAGVVLLDRAGAALFVNRSMRTIARRRDGLALDRNGYPLPAHLTARRQLEGLIEDVHLGGSGGVMRIPRADLCHAYAVLVAAVPSSLAHGLLDGQGGNASALVLVHDPIVQNCLAVSMV